MNYLDVYSKVFNNKTYSRGSHIQYGFALQEIIDLYTIEKKFNLIDIGSGRGQLIKKIKKFTHADITSVDINKFHNLDVTFLKCDLSKSSEREELMKKRI
jgi:ubiquinone/menaquinone biosynthesis C-methylase UbiE